MVYRGLKLKNIDKHAGLSRKRENIKVKILRFGQTPVRRLAYRHLYFYIPPTWDFLVYQYAPNGRRVVYMYSPIYFLNLTLPKSNTVIHSSPRSRVLYFTTLYSNASVTLYLNQIRRITCMFYRPLFHKIKFKGKGYYIYKNRRNTITPQFGYSHRLYTYAYFMTVRFLSKTSIFIFGHLKLDMSQLAHAIKRMRPINIFTGRGVRFAKQTVYKKAGKVSSYR